VRDLPANERLVVRAARYRDDIVAERLRALDDLPAGRASCTEDDESQGLNPLLFCCFIVAARHARQARSRPSFDWQSRRGMHRSP
jgi:hypothetical protein